MIVHFLSKNDITRICDKLYALLSYTAVSEAETAISHYKSLGANSLSHRPIWAVGENYRFEPAFVEVYLCTLFQLLLLLFVMFVMYF